ncbi:hypothetical protein BX661DRAFT_177231 [Kickxella alabastrina]|uniref:uncharacterized protein n=1 Tax=Kickxella alabastrina TaxID=61397 RepID=UPI00221F0714|nr:uncharacterized protein BX661DRAFT_177231 [Kickxella alabastrina]KAI7833611.1 hypothetical protein BX661DRAFT_177231 [Kickxella alabastrina]
MGNQLSFAVTESELQRQRASMAKGYSLDPRGKGDAIMIVIISMFYGIKFLAVLYMLWNRNYPPLKAKNLTIMTLVMVASVIWFVGDLQTNGHIPLANTHLTNCKAFGIWGRLLFGVCLQNSLISLRAYILYRVFGRSLTSHSLALYIPYFMYLMCLVIFGVVMQILKPAITIEYRPDIDLCSHANGFVVAMFSIIAATVIIGLAVHWKIRRIKSSFNENREMIVAYVIVLFVLLFTAILSATRRKYIRDVRLRIIFTSLSHFMTNSMWWLIMAVPLYKCAFDRERYLTQWISKLHKDGLQKEYNVELNATDVNVCKLLLAANSEGNKEVANIFPTEDSIYGDKDGDFCANKHVSFSRPSEISISSHGGSSYERVTRLSSAVDRHQGNILPANPNSYVVPPVGPQFYTPISIPENAVMAPLTLIAAHNRHLDNYDSSNRHLL